MLKKFTVVLFAVILTTFGPYWAMAEEQVPAMNLNGVPLYFVNNINPIIRNGSIFVPLREFTQTLGGQINWNSSTDTVDLEIPHAVASNTQNQVYLYPFECSKSAYKGFVLESNRQRKYFDWTALTSREVQLACLDINKDDRDEIVVILCQATGTGVAQYEIHILDMETFAEIPVENPLDYISREVRTLITQTSTELLIDIKIGDKESHLCRRGLPVFANDNIYFGNVIRYETEGPNVYCTVAGQYSPGGFVGDFRVYYEYDTATQSMKAFKVVFEEYDNRVGS